MREKPLPAAHKQQAFSINQRPNRALPPHAMPPPRTTVHRVHRASCVVAERKPGVAPTDLTDADVPLPPPNGPVGEAVAVATELALFRCV